MRDIANTVFYSESNTFSRKNPAPFARVLDCCLVGELVAGGSRGTQPLALPRATASTVVVMVVIHLHVAAVAAVVGAAGATGELGLLIHLDSFLDIDLFHSDFPFIVKN